MHNDIDNDWPTFSNELKYRHNRIMILCSLIASRTIKKVLGSVAIFILFTHSRSLYLSSARATTIAVLLDHRASTNSGHNNRKTANYERELKLNIITFLFVCCSQHGVQQQEDDETECCTTIQFT